MDRRSAFTDAEGIATVRTAVRLALSDGRDAAEVYLRESGIGGGEAHFVLLFIDHHLFEEQRQRAMAARTQAWEDWPEEIQMLLTFYLGLPTREGYHGS